MDEAGVTEPVTGLTFSDRVVYVDRADTVVLADLHLGRDVKSAVDAPLGERSVIAERMRAILDRFRPSEVVIAGDVLHAFDAVPESVEDSLAVVKEVVAGGAEAAPVFVAGNHDTLLDTFVDSVPEYRLDDGETVVCHGHELPETTAPRYLIGHDHPAIRIEGTRHPCFLVGTATHLGSEVVTLPAFNPLAIGMLVNELDDGDFASPLVRGVGDFRPVVRDESADDTLYFPPLEQLREHL